MSLLSHLVSFILGGIFFLAATVGALFAFVCLLLYLIDLHDDLDSNFSFFDFVFFFFFFFLKKKKKKKKKTASFQNGQEQEIQQNARSQGQRSARESARQELLGNERRRAFGRI